MTQKCILIFQIFGDEPQLGGDKPWSKNGDKCQMGDWQNFRQLGGTPQSSPGKNPDFCMFWVSSIPDWLQHVPIVYRAYEWQWIAMSFFFQIFSPIPIPCIQSYALQNDCLDIFFSPTDSIKSKWFICFLAFCFL